MIHEMMKGEAFNKPEIEYSNFESDEMYGTTIRGVMYKSVTLTKHSSKSDRNSVTASDLQSEFYVSER